MARPKGSGGTRQVVYLSDENVLAVHVALTPAGDSKPPFGAISKFINLLLDNWRSQQAFKEPAK